MKDSTVSARVECDVKEAAESILDQLGIPVSVVINSLYRQIIFNNGIPFPMTIPKEPATRDSISDEELSQKLFHSYLQSMRGEGKPIDEVFANIEKNQ